MLMSAPEIGDPTMFATGIPRRNNDVARAFTEAGNHIEM